MEIKLREFYKGYKTFDLEESEIIKLISFKIPPKNYLFNFEKISRRNYLDIASVNSSFFALIDEGVFTDARISAGGVAPIPLYLKNVSEYLIGKRPESETLKECIEIALNEILPISDARGSAKYKALLLRQLILAHFEKFFPELVTLELVLQED